MHRSAPKPPISMFALLCMLALAGAFLCAVRSAAHASQANAGVTIEGTMSQRLHPGSTAAVTFAVVNSSSHDQTVGRIVLTGIEADPDHRSCPTSIAGDGTDFSMPPVEVGGSYPPGRSTVAATGRVSMNEIGVDQDDCRGATLTLTFRAS